MSSSMALQSSSLKEFDDHVKKAVDVGEIIRKMRVKLFISTSHRVIKDNENFWDSHARKSKK